MADANKIEAPVRIFFLNSYSYKKSLKILA